MNSVEHSQNGIDARCWNFPHAIDNDDSHRYSQSRRWGESDVSENSFVEFGESHANQDCVREQRWTFTNEAIVISVSNYVDLHRA